MGRNARRGMQAAASRLAGWIASLMLVAMALATAGGAAAGTPAPAPTQVVTLMSVSSGECLQPINGSLTQGDAVVQQRCDGSAAQQWTITNLDCSTCTSVHLINGASHLCLDARGDGANGTPIQQWTCDSISNENWNFGERYNQLVSAIPHQPGGPHCLVTPGTQAGQAMVLEYCGPSSSLWNRPVVVTATAPPTPAPAPAITLVSVMSGECLQPINGSLQQGDAVVQEPCDGGAAQQWTIPNVNCTTCVSVHLVNVASHLCLDARGTGVNGTPIQQWTCNAISNENWNFGERYNQLVSAIPHQPGGPHCLVTPGTQAGLAMVLEYCGPSSSLWNRPAVVTASSDVSPRTGP
jgi:hypothetical protein